MSLEETAATVIATASESEEVTTSSSELEASSVFCAPEARLGDASSAYCAPEARLADASTTLKGAVVLTVCETF